MCYPSEIRKDFVRKQGWRCQISGEKKKLEAHSSTRYHLVNSLNKVVDGVLLNHDVHQYIHDYANYLEEEDDVASPETVHRATWEVLNATLGQEALDRLKQVSLKFVGGLISHMERKYTIQPDFKHYVEGDYRTLKRRNGSGLVKS